MIGFKYIPSKGSIPAEERAVHNRPLLDTASLLGVARLALLPYDYLPKAPRGGLSRWRFEAQSCLKNSKLIRPSHDWGIFHNASD